MVPPLFSAIRNIGAFYFGGMDNDYDWTTPHSNVLWQDRNKTLFDPCPSGWRVPPSGESDRSPWQNLTLDNGQWQGTGPDRGRLWAAAPVFGGATWYPLTGYRDYAFGLPSAGMAHYQSSTAIPIMIYVFYFTQPVVMPGHRAHRAHGFSVRCIRE